ncbi:MAG: AAA family ATPase [Blastocatellia bacterium]
MKNPFTLEVAIGSRNLVNRAMELEKVRSSLRGGSKLFVIGPRRFGKTSILLTAAEELRAAGDVALDYNIEGYTSLDLLVRALVTGAASLSSSLDQAAKSVRRFFTSLQPTVSVDAEGVISASLGIKQPEPAEQAPLLIETLNNLERLAASSKCNVGVIFDEFQHLLKLGGAGIEGQLRAAVQTHRHVGYVFAGSQTTLISDMVTNHARPFYRMGESIFIGAIPREEFLPYLAANFKAIKCKADEAALGKLLDLAEDVPYNVQALARGCWDEAAQAKAVTLSAALVVATHRRLVRSHAPIYAPSWASLSTNQQKSLAAAASMDGTQLLSRPILKRYDLSPGTMQKALQALEAQAILRRDYQDVEVRYRFEDPFFKAWILASTVSSHP